MFDLKITNLSNKSDADKIYDAIIIGGGPGGLTAALYAGRYRLDTLLIEKQFISGGQMATTEWIENYPGFVEPVLGNDLATAMEKQARNAGTQFINANVTELALDGEIKRIKAGNGEFKAKTVIISTGASPRLMGIPGEKEYKGRGVSYCATCDGPFYPDKTVAVVGGGNTALEEGMFLAKYAKKIYLIHRRESFRADKIVQERLEKEEKIEAIFNAQVKAINFDSEDDRHILLSTPGEEKKLFVDGIFIFIGMNPNNDLFKGKLELDHSGYIITDCYMATNIPGVYAVGDIRAKHLRQIATSVGDGAIAAHSANKFIEKL